MKNMPHRQSKPIDRLPIICAAGLKPDPSPPIANVLKEYPRDELAEQMVLHHEHTTKKKPPEPASIIIPETNNLKNIISPDLHKSRFLEFKDQFYDRLYCKKVPLGKPTPANSKPDHITNESVTFGNTIERSEGVYELALPNRCPRDVIKEFVEWHDKYIISHRSYFPSEQINRHYNKHFDKNEMFGKSKKIADKSGEKVRRLIQRTNPHDFKTCIVSKQYEEHIERHKAPVGKPTLRQIYNLQPDMIFGRPVVLDEYDVNGILKSMATPAEVTNFANDTTYRSFANDIKYSPIECRQPAGKFKSLYPQKGQCKFMAENIGEETTVKQLISPSIPSHFGLSHRDFFLPRPKDQIRRIFTKAGYDLSDDEHFEKVWDMALREWTSIGSLVSVEAFKYAYAQCKRDHKKKIE